MGERGSGIEYERNGCEIGIVVGGYLVHEVLEFLGVAGDEQLVAVAGVVSIREVLLIGDHIAHSAHRLHLL